MLETSPTLQTIRTMNHQGIMAHHSPTAGTTAANPVKRGKAGKRNGKRIGASPGLLVPRTIPAGTTASSALR